MRKFEPAVLPGVNLEFIGADCWMNDIYTVIKYDCSRVGEKLENWPEMWWLSIKRNDKEIIRDWRELQEIKNILIGAENEAVELFPAESRKVDTANQYHLFVLKDKNLRFPFGYYRREILNSQEALKVGAKQRKL